ncbi:tetratricopeptide repeat protein [Streptomyces sp. NPDC058694]|uniref:tetratricopeptide repeat protein n=1 Tax=Streptomyces sp. NPDC058694 TaxID=3346603 RepID=UPI003653A60F
MHFSTVVQGQHITMRLPAKVPTALAGLPPSSHAFTGRDQHVQELLAGLAPGAAGKERTTLVTSVAGMAGVGKTELAVHTAERALDELGWFPGGVLFIDLFGYDYDRRLSPERALDSLLHALAMDEHHAMDVQDRTRLYRSVLAAYAEQGQRILVVLDNASSAEQVAPLLPADGRTAALVTSRNTLAIETRIHRLDVLDEGASIDLLRRAVAVALREADFRVTDAPAEASAIARLCAGLPLALRMAAALLTTAPSRPLTSLARALDEEHTRLDRLGPRRGDHPVRAAFQLSYQQLDAEHARMFRLLSLNPGPDVATETAARLAAADADEAEDLLRGLASAHLVEYGDRWGRWRVHDLVRLYARELAAADPDAPDAQRRLLDHYLDRARRASSYILELPGKAPLGFPDRDRAVAWLEAERANLRAAVELAASSPHLDIAWDLARALDSWWIERNGEEWLSVARTAARATHRAGDRRSESQALVDLSHALRQNGAIEEAIATAREAIELARVVGDKGLEGKGLRALADGLGFAQQLPQAVNTYRQAVVLLREGGEEHVAGTALLNLGVTLTNAGQAQDAISAFQEALEVLSRTSRSVEALAWQGLGNTFEDVDRLEDAAQCYRRAITLSREVGGQWDLINEGRALLYLGRVLRDQGQYESANQTLQQAVAMYTSLGDSAGEATALGELGISLTAHGRPEEAAAALTSASEIFHELSHRTDEAMAQKCLGKALAAAGRIEEAICAFTQAAEIFHETGDSDSEEKALEARQVAYEHPAHESRQQPNR